LRGVPRRPLGARRGQPAVVGSQRLDVVVAQLVGGHLHRRDLADALAEQDHLQRDELALLPRQRGDVGRDAAAVGPMAGRAALRRDDGAACRVARLRGQRSRGQPEQGQGPCSASHRW
jgi:hypothetical protein